MPLYFRGSRLEGDSILEAGARTQSMGGPPRQTALGNHFLGGNPTRIGQEASTGHVRPKLRNDRSLALRFFRGNSRRITCGSQFGIQDIDDAIIHILGQQLFKVTEHGFDFGLFARIA